MNVNKKNDNKILDFEDKLDIIIKQNKQIKDKLNELLNKNKNINITNFYSNSNDEFTF